MTFFFFYLDLEFEFLTVLILLLFCLNFVILFLLFHFVYLIIFTQNMLFFYLSCYMSGIFVSSYNYLTFKNYLNFLQIKKDDRICWQFFGIWVNLFLSFSSNKILLGYLLKIFSSSHFLLYNHFIYWQYFLFSEIL